jgi:hypothetical protein
MFKNKIFWIISVIVITIPAFLSLLRPGLYPMQDDHHVFRMFEMNKCFNDGQIPCRWIPDAGYGYGYPQFNFYAPAIYYFGQLFYTLGFQFVDVIKILIVLGFMLGATGMYILTKEFFGNFAGFVAASFYTFAPYKAQQIYVRGSLSEFWASVFFPLILWSLYKVIKSPEKKYLAIGAVSIAGLFITHNILSFLFVPIIIFWVVFWMYKLRRPFFSFKPLNFTLILGFLLSSFFVLPMLIERGFVHSETLLGGYFDYRQHFVTFRQLFFSNNWGYGSSMLGPIDDLSLSTGMVHWTVGLAAVLFALYKFRKDKKFPVLILGLGIIELTILFLMHQRSSFIWEAVGPLAWLQFPWRFLSLSVFLLSFMSAYTIYSLGKVKYLAGIVLIALVLMLHSGFFAPKAWFETTDEQELSGSKWEKQLTNSIFDYLPIYAHLPPDSKAAEIPEVLRGRVVFENYYKGTNYQTAKILAEDDSRVRLPLFDFPGMTVYLNGRVLPHVNTDCTGEEFCKGLITFDLPKGGYDFEVKLENTRVRILANILTLAGVSALVFLLVKKDVKIY